MPRPLVAAAIATVIAAFGGTATAVGSGAKYHPDIRPQDFGGPIDNPYFPVVPGTRWVYEGTTVDGTERIVVEATGETKKILGIDAVVVRDTASINGSMTEDTFDWYAQDRDGNVWYLGEDTKEYENGAVTSTKGSWEAGVDGAQPGIVMLAKPRVGKSYRQEFSAGEAEDRATVLKVNASTDVPTGTYDHVIVTKDFSLIEPSIVEHKSYARGVGVVLEVQVKGGPERVELIEFTKA